MTRYISLSNNFLVTAVPLVHQVQQHCWLLIRHNVSIRCICHCVSYAELEWTQVLSEVTYPIPSSCCHVLCMNCTHILNHRAWCTCTLLKGRAKQFLPRFGPDCHEWYAGRIHKPDVPFEARTRERSIRHVSIKFDANASCVWNDATCDVWRIC